MPSDPNIKSQLILRQVTVGAPLPCARCAELRALLARLVDAMEVCEGNRGRFSCSEPHDNRCPKGRVDGPEKWRGVWECKCGAEELEAAVGAAREVRP